MNINQPITPNEPRLAKEKIMGGGKTEGVPEFEELKESPGKYFLRFPRQNLLLETLK